MLSVICFQPFSGKYCSLTKWALCGSFFRYCPKPKSFFATGADFSTCALKTLSDNGTTRVNRSGWGTDTHTVRPSNNTFEAGYNNGGGTGTGGGGLLEDDAPSQLIETGKLTP